MASIGSEYNSRNHPDYQLYRTNQYRVNRTKGTGLNNNKVRNQAVLLDVDSSSLCEVKTEGRHVAQRSC